MDTALSFDPSALRAEMARRRLTVEALSNQTGISTSAINKMLSPNGNPQAANLARIADAMNVDVGIFFARRLHDSADRSGEVPA